MLLVGLTGPAHSGKDTTFGFIHEWAEGRGLTAVRRGFADQLKLSAARLFHPEIGLQDAIDWCNLIKESGMIFVSDTEGLTNHKEVTGRQFLQRYGTEAHRDVFGTDFWVDALLPCERGPFDWYKEWGVGHQQKGVAVITDVRFENEAERVDLLDGVNIKLVRPEVDGVGDTHVSESGIHPVYIHYELVNDGDLDDLRAATFSLMDDIYKEHML